LWTVRLLSVIAAVLAIALLADAPRAVQVVLAWGQCAVVGWYALGLLLTGLRQRGDRPGR